MKLFQKNTQNPSGEGKGGLRNLLRGVRADAERQNSRERIRLDKRKLRWQIVQMLAVSLLLTIVMEILNRRSLAKFGLFVIEHPLMFLFDAFLVLNTLSVSHLFRRRLAVLTTVTTIWLALCVTNFIVICFRTQPFTLADVLLVKDMFSLITVYFSWFEIIGTAILIVVIIAGLVYLFLRAPRRERVHYVPAVAAFAVITALSIGFVNIGTSTGKIKERFTTLKDAYQDYGFAYTFLNTFADLGMSRPREYSEDTVEAILNESESDKPQQVDEDVIPNIVYVQLESFFDADILADTIQFSEYPTPNYHDLLERWPSGALSVPVVGGGTANTEFEMLTGMNLDFFGAGEYPYYTVMREKPCESICYVLNRLGFYSTAVHDYMATFYGRNEVYSRLGFETFESMEYMDDLEYGEVGWAKDERLIESVLDAMRATPGQDFVLGVTVSTHGKYSREELLPCAQNGIEVVSTDEHLDAIQLQNYINLAKGMDDFLPKFLDAMKNFEEPVICVFYGDHLPALDWDAACVKNGDLFQTQYCIWTNYGRCFSAPDAQAYQVTASLLKQLGIEDGVMFKYHQQYDVGDTGIGYLTEMENLQYDLLYGDLVAYQGEYPFEPTELKMGIDPVKIASVEFRYDRLLVKGENFNEFSEILLDGEVLPTAYVDRNTLAAVMEELPEEAANLVVAQLSSENVELSRTDDFPVEKFKN